MPQITGGQLLARTLADAGVTHAFGIHGGHLDAMLVAMAKEGITLIDTRHEAAGGHAAQAYAVAKGTVGVCFATSGPGFTNVLTAVANAHSDRTPLLVLTSSPPQREAELNVLQSGIDQVAMANPITRWAHRVTTVARVPDMTAQAIRRAYGGVPGPVVLDVPIDVMFRAVDEELATRPRIFRTASVAPSSEVVASTVDVLRRAERPVLVVGEGATTSPGVRDALESLLKTTSIPTVEASTVLGTLPASAPARLGSMTELGVLPAIGQVPDALILVGVRQGMSLGGRNTPLIPAHAAIVHVDVDPAELGRIGNPEVAAVADPAQFALALDEALTSSDDVDFSTWNDTARSVIGLADKAWDGTEPTTTSGRVHPYVAAAEIWRNLADSDVVVFDGGESSGWISMQARAQRLGDYQGIGMLGGLGVGTGFSIGLSYARPGQRVVAVTGDGAMGFNIQEWDTMVRFNLPITTVVFNNLGWGMSFHGQDAIFGEGRRVVSDLPDTRYDRIAEGFGMYAELVERAEDVGPALERARQSGGPACLNIKIAPEVVHSMMSGLSAEIGEGDTRIPYYEAIPAGEL